MYWPILFQNKVELRLNIQPIITAIQSHYYPLSKSSTAYW